MSTENFTYDWSSFTKRVNVKAAAGAIYPMWATQHGLEQWFLRKADFNAADKTRRERDSLVQPGDTYAWLWHGYDDTTTENGEILEANGSNRLKFIFGAAGTVTVSIYEEQGETIIELLQENIPTSEKGKAWFHVGCSTGWVFYLTNLKSILEGGVDLRNKNVHLQRVVTA
jgi:hypothetical protein